MRPVPILRISITLSLLDNISKAASHSHHAAIPCRWFSIILILRLKLEFDNWLSDLICQHHCAAVA